MRTVHETEALRPSDPVPKTQLPGSTATPTTKIQRIKLKLTAQPKEESETPSIQINGGGEAAGTLVVDHHHHHPGAVAAAEAEEEEDLDEIPLPEFGSELGFDEHELSLRPKELYRLLRRQIHWAEVEMAKLRREWEENIEPQRFEAWRAKEAIFDDVISAEQRLHDVLVEREGENAAAPNGHHVGHEQQLLLQQQNGVEVMST
jgi:hypothetical protein